MKKINKNKILKKIQKYFQKQKDYYKIIKMMIMMMKIMNKLKKIQKIKIIK